MRQICDRFMKNISTMNGKPLFYYSGYFPATGTLDTQNHSSCIKVSRCSQHRGSLKDEVYNPVHSFLPRNCYAHTSHLGLASGSKFLQ
ncbi:hypothetical protein C3Z09_16110 [Lelliottia aquatilis]|nr:hypothetical protein C3Z09_16110 [Lelliottia aquatilis]